MKLRKHEYILTAYAYAPSGPGWSNRLVVAIVENRATGKLRSVSFQPRKHTPEMQLLFEVACIIHRQLTVEAAKLLKP